MNSPGTARNASNTAYLPNLKHSAKQMVRRHERADLHGRPHPQLLLAIRSLAKPGAYSIPEKGLLRSECSTC